MKIPSWFERMLAKKGFVKIPGASGSGGGYAGFFGWTNVGSRVEQLKAYQNHVYKCVSVIYRRVMSVPYRLYVERTDEDEEVKRHPLLDLMYAPNPYMSGTFLIALTQMHLDLSGMAFWLKVRNGLGRPAELWPLSPALFSRFVLNESRTDLISYEFLTDTGSHVNYRPEEIVYFHYPHPIYWLEGCSPIQAMAYSYDIDLASRTYQRNFFQNSARPDIVLESDQEIGVEDAKRLLLGWKSAHQGVSKAWEPAILDKGLKANVITMNMKDMEFASLANLHKEDILEAYNIPPGKLGTVADVNRANGIALDITFNSECIKPKLMLFDETVSRFLAPDFDTRIYLQHDECVPRDEDSDRAERESNLRNKVTTINEERAKLGMEPVEWGEKPWISIAEIQYGDTYELNSESETLQESASEPSPTDPKSSPTDSNSTVGAGFKPAQDDETKRLSATRIRLAHERKVAARTRLFRTSLRKYFGSQRDRVIRNLEEFYPRVQGATAGMSIKKTRAWLDAHKDQVDRINFLIEPANAELINSATPFLQAALVDAGEASISLVGAVDVAFDLSNPRVIRWLGNQTGLIRDINRTTHEAIDTALRAGFEAGESMQQISGRIGQVFDNADKVRSLRIAQTQINSAANTGTLEGYQQSGVVEKKEWIAGPDARETHQAAAARYKGDGAIPIGENFEVGKGRGPAPGNIGRPEEDIN